MPITINKQYQFIKFLGSSNLSLNSLSGSITNQIAIIYGISADGSSYLSWSNSAFSSLQNLETYKTYLIVSNSANPNYTLYSGSEVVDASTSTEITTTRSMETYRGATPLTLSSASFKNNMYNFRLNSHLLFQDRSCFSLNNQLIDLEFQNYSVLKLNYYKEQMKIHYKRYCD